MPANTLSFDRAILPAASFFCETFAECSLIELAIKRHHFSFLLVLYVISVGAERVCSCVSFSQR